MTIAPKWKTRRIDPEAFRRTFATVSHEYTTSNIKVYYPSTVAAFDAVQYVLCTDALLGVVRTPSGAIAAFRDGEFAGWHPTVAIAAEVCRSTFR